MVLMFLSVNTEKFLCKDLLIKEDKNIIYWTFLDNVIELYFTSQVNHLFKVYNAVVVDIIQSILIFTTITTVNLKTFSLPQKEILHHLSSTTLPLTPSNLLIYFLFIFLFWTFNMNGIITVCD